MTDDLHRPVSSCNDFSQAVPEAAVPVAAIATLSQSQELTQQILESSDDCIKVLDLEGHILFMSPGEQALLGIQDITPFFHMPWVKFWTGVDQQAAMEAIAGARVGKVCAFQGYRPTLTGEPKWWDNKISPIRGVKGQIERLLCISRDITQRKQSEDQRQQAEEQLRQSEKRLSAIFSQAAVGLSEVSLDGRFQRVNDELCRLLGRSREEMLAAGVLEITHPEDVPKSLKAIQQLLETGGPISLDKRYLRPDGTTVWANSSLTRLDDEQGCPHTLLAVTVDLSDRQRIEEERKRAEVVLRRAAEFDAFRISLTDALRPLADPVEIQATASRVLGKYLSANRVAYFEVRGADYVVERDYVNGADPIAGGYLIDSFGPALLAAYRSGQAVSMSDVAADPTLSSAQQSVYAAIQIGAYIGIPLIKDGELVAGLAVHTAGPRAWTPDEVALAEEVAERTWAAVERARAEAALHQSEQQFRLMADAVPQIVWITDAEGRVEFFNKQWSNYTGVPYEPTTAAEVATNFVHPEDSDRTIKAFNEARCRGDVFSVEHRIRSVAGSYRWFLVRAEPYRHPQTGEIIRWFGASVDIHDRKLAEEALREREQRLSIATEAAQLGIFEWKVPEDITIWENNRQYELFGLTPADGSVSAQDFFENYLHPDDAEALTAKMTEAMQTGILLQTSYRICRKDGTTRWIEVNGQFEFADDGSPLRFVGVNADITERVRIEDERKQAEAIITTDLENTRLLHDLSARLVAEDNIQVLYDEIVSAAMTLTQADAGSIQVLDESTEELVLLATQGIDRTVTDHFQRVTARSITSCGVVLATGKRAFVDFDVPESEDPDGSLRLHLNAGLISAQSTPLISRSGRRIGMVSTHWCKHHRPSDRELQFLDLLARQAADLIEQRQTTAEREQLLAREQIAREEAERANRIKDEFLAVLSHELRSPLNPILGWARLLQNGKLDEAKTQQALKIIERNAQLQSELIEDLLDVSRILQGKLNLNPSPLNLSSIIRAAIETVRLAAEAKTIKLEASLTDVGLVFGDATRLQQVIWNLLSNAVKFTPGGGQVSIRLERLDSHAYITVSDTGQGIAPEFLPYVFDYFRQANGSTTRQSGGLGLGLAIVRHLVELHGGTARVASPGVGMGATFTVTLPIRRVQATIEQTHAASELSCDLHGIQVLVVDDELDSREFAAFVLEQAGASVLTAATAHEALALLIRAQPDVLLSDIGMPNMDGYMLMQQVRALPPEQGGQVRAIALSAYAGDFNQQQALQAGFQRHLAKPVEPEDLAKAIIALVKS